MEFFISRTAQLINKFCRRLPNLKNWPLKRHDTFLSHYGIDFFLNLSQNESQLKWSSWLREKERPRERKREGGRERGIFEKRLT